MTFVPLAAMALVLWVRTKKAVFYIGFAGTVLNVLFSFYMLAVFDAGFSGINLFENVQAFGFNYAVGVDGVNVLFIPMTTIFAFLVLMYVVALDRSGAADRYYVAAILAYEAVLIGAFASLNALQFWFWTLLELAPVIFLTVHAGTGLHRRLAVDRLLKFWSCGLLMTLCGFLLLAVGLVDSEHSLSFDWLTIKQRSSDLHDEALIFVLLFYGFAIRMPLFPFHGWLPLLAEQGTISGSVVFLAGLKLGIFAVLRFILPLLPAAAEDWAALVVALAFISIFYGALMALVQINIWRLLAFAVISQTGILVIGVFCFNELGLEGAMMFAVGNGLATAGMLFSVGLIYTSTETALLPRLGGLFDTNPTLALLFLFSALSTLVMPGTPGFDAMHLILEGSIEEHGWLAAVAIMVGNLLAAAFILWAFQRIFMAAPRRAVRPRLSFQHQIVKQRLIAVMVCALLAGTGFYMRPWLALIDQDTALITRGYPEHSTRSHGRNSEPPAESPDTSGEHR
ncbi:MAG: complex I subunit 4 family protein [Gammaproteobacteria bacterium]